MDSQINCFFCKKEFSSTSTRNRHLNNIHRVEVETNRNKRIICPSCPNETAEVLNNHEDLNKHLDAVHCINIKQTDIYFLNVEEFEIWRRQEPRGVNYARARTIKRNDGTEVVYYKCNRSDSRGFKSNCHKRSPKAGGSIKMFGVCPSRIVAKVLKNGVVTVTFIETHVGHTDKLRAKRLTQLKQDKIVKQLNDGVTNERILKTEMCSLGEESHGNDENVLVGDSSGLKAKLQDEIGHDIEETCSTTSNELVDEKYKQINLEGVCNFAKQLDMEMFKKFMGMVKDVMKKIEEE